MGTLGCPVGILGGPPAAIFRTFDLKRGQKCEKHEEYAGWLFRNLGSPEVPRSPLGAPWDLLGPLGVALGPLGTPWATLGAPRGSPGGGWGGGVEEGGGGGDRNI